MVTRALRRLAGVLTTSDPDLSRLRLAATTIATLAVAVVLLFVGASAVGQPVTAVIPGVIVAMIASLAVRESEPGRLAVGILLLVPASVFAIALGSLVSPLALLADVVFVAIAAGAVFLRTIGPRGVAIGMIAFMSYFLSLFVKTTPAQLPVVAAAVLVGALVTLGMRLLLRPRHPERDLRRMLSALGLHAGRVLDTLEEGVRATGLDGRRRATLRSRVAAFGATASAVEQALADEDAQILSDVDNDELAVRVFDFQLAIERLVAQTDRELRAQRPHGPAREQPARERLAADLRAFAGAVRAPVRGSRERPSAFDAWDRVVATHTDEAAPDETMPNESTREAAAPDAPADDDTHPDRRERLLDGARSALQVAVAAALAIAAGTALSSTRWYWAVIAAFVVYIGTSTRGEILTKGSQRVLGTIGGVVAGVIIAALVGSNTVLAVALIAVCLFLGIYLMSISSAIMIFFITTMLALLYGLLGMFSVGLLLTRLEETAAGAAIGVLVSYVVLPSSTRDAAREGVQAFLERLAQLLGSAATALTGGPVPGSVPVDARALRGAFDTLKTTTKPLTEGLAGVSNRSGSRRTMQILAACEYHGRSLLRLSDRTAAIADTPALRTAVDDAVGAVRRNIETFRAALTERMSAVTMHPATALMDALEQHANTLDQPQRLRLVAVTRHLRAIDQAICARAQELGAELTPAPNGSG